MTASSVSRPLARMVVFLGALLSLLAAIPTAASAAITTFGSPLSVPATLNTAENLNYPGTDTSVPPSPEAPTGVVHTYHYGADTALWDTQGAAPATGQALSVALEGCAKPAAGGPPPLTQIHFQAISPLPGGGAKVNLSSQPYDIPVCGQDGASNSTVTTYHPVNLCVAAGDYVAFNDEGGFVEHSYQSGVPYEVIGAVRGSTLDSFIRGDGTKNGAVMASSDTSTMDGFAATRDEELMMQMTLGTGSDATHICAGGTAGLPPVLPPIRVGQQTDGVNHQRIVAVAIYCRLSPECKGSAVLALAGKAKSGRLADKAVVGHSNFSLPGPKTSHLPIRVSPSVLALVRKSHGHGVSTTLTVVVNGKTIVQTINVKIL